MIQLGLDAFVEMIEARFGRAAANSVLVMLYLALFGGTVIALITAFGLVADAVQGAVGSRFSWGGLFKLFLVLTWLAIVPDAVSRFLSYRQKRSLDRNITRIIRMMEEAGGTQSFLDQVHAAADKSTSERVQAAEDRAHAEEVLTKMDATRDEIVRLITEHRVRQGDTRESVDEITDPR